MAPVSCCAKKWFGHEVCVNSESININIYVFMLTFRSTHLQTGFSPNMFAAIVYFRQNWTFTVKDVMCYFKNSGKHRLTDWITNLGKGAEIHELGVVSDNVKWSSSSIMT